MKPLLSIVVPVLNEARYLPLLLARLRGFGEQVETLVVDGGSSDGSQDLVRADGRAILLAAARGRASQMNAGAAQAKAPLLFFMHGDTLPPLEAPELITQALTDSGVLAGSFRLAFDRDSILLRFYAWCSSANNLFTTYGDQGLFLRRSDFEALGGFPDLPFLEDIELQRRLRRQGKVVKLDSALRTSARRFERYGVLGQQLRNVAIVFAYLAGARPARLKSLYSDLR
jgi:rSAM/selenodomain-associated transferase 2